MRKILYALILLAGIFTFVACDTDDGVGKPQPQRIVLENTSFEVVIGQVPADTTVLNLRWIDAAPPQTYRLTLANALNANTVDIADNSQPGNFNVKTLPITDTQLVGYMEQMQVPAEGSQPLQLTIFGNKSNGVADSVTAHINVAFLGQ